MEKLKKDLGQGKEVPMFAGQKPIPKQTIEIGLGMGMEDSDEMEDGSNDEDELDT